METDPRRKCKVYRHTYLLNDEIMSIIHDKSIPRILKNSHSRDVSDEYFNTTLALPVDDKSKTYYLGVFDKEKITPIVKGDVVDGIVTFGVVEDKNIYLLLSGTAQDLRLESAPFIFRKNGLHYLAADTSKMKNETLYRKYPMPMWNKERLYRVIGAKFYASDAVDKAGRELYEICDTPIVCYNTYVFDTVNRNRQRYIKYVVRDDVPVELAEMHFYKDNNEVKPVNVIAGEPYDQRNPDMKLDNCFDGDPLTYYLSKDAGDSIIFDFGRPVSITHVVCVPRNDDNFIRIGDEYELFYFDNNKGWIPILKQVATQVTMPCRVPSNALLLLRDRTRGKEEQMFYFSNHKQIYINDIQ